MAKFEYDARKNLANQLKHGVSFEQAKQVFYDPRLVILEDLLHSHDEPRYFAYGLVEGEVLTVRFTRRQGKIRIFGAAYWRKGRKIYEEKNSL